MKYSVVHVYGVIHGKGLGFRSRVRADMASGDSRKESPEAVLHSGLLHSRKLTLEAQKGALYRGW